MVKKKTIKRKGVKTTRDASTQTDPVIIRPKKKRVKKKQQIEGLVKNPSTVAGKNKKKNVVAKKKRNTETRGVATTTRQNGTKNKTTKAATGAPITKGKKKKKKVIVTQKKNTGNKNAKKKKGGASKFEGSAGPVRSTIEIENKMTNKEAKEKYPSVIHMFSGCDDHERSAGLANVGKNFKLLDNPNRKAGGACTASLLTILKLRHQKKKKGFLVGDLSYGKVLKDMRKMLKQKGYKQNPQLSSTRKIKMKQKFDLVPDGIVDGLIGKLFGTKRAVLIGINYEHDEDAMLRGCHNDVRNWKAYLKDVHGFKPKNMQTLLDKEDFKKQPTRANIIAAYKKIVKQSKRGDIVFCHFSGHGGQRPHGNGMAQTLIPVDYAENGKIYDFELNEIMCQSLRKGVYCTFIYDCCHSATMLDLPFRFQTQKKDALTKLMDKIDTIF